MLKIGKVLTVVAAVVSLPNAAFAQSCAQLEARLAGNSGEFLSIAVDFPKTHAAILGCIMGNEKSDDAAACAVTMIAGACVFMGPDDCGDLTSRWARVGIEYQSVANQMRALGCN